MHITIYSLSVFCCCLSRVSVSVCAVPALRSFQSSSFLLSKCVLCIYRMNIFVSIKHTPDSPRRLLSAQYHGICICISSLYKHTNAYLRRRRRLGFFFSLRIFNNKKFYFHVFLWCLRALRGRPAPSNGYGAVYM